MTPKNDTVVSVVPWLNAVQFKKVYEYLYSDEITKKKWAVDTISVWETRCRPSLPTAIEATYVLTSAVIQDILWTNETTLITYTDLQGVYGSAITRFVSLSVEAYKSKESQTFPNAKVAKLIGIPSFIVDIRNEWCHSSRPSLSMLRLAAQSALKYLKESYWDKEAACVNNYVRQPPDETELYILFTDFIKFQDNILKSEKFKLIKSDDGTACRNPEYIMLLTNLENYLKKYKQLFVNVLVYDGIFIPIDEELKHVVSEEEYTLFNNEYYLDEEEEEDEVDEMDTDDIIKYVQFETKYMPELPEYHENLWEPVIKLLNKHDTVPLFMEALLKSQGNRTVVGQKLLISWILKILRIHSASAFSLESGKLKKIFRSKGIVPNWLRMLHSAMVNPCKYLLVILPLILDNLNLKKEIVIRITCMALLKLGLLPGRECRKEYSKLFHTVKELKNDLEFQRNFHKEHVAEKIWSSCPDDCHKLWPIGHIINVIKDEEETEEEIRDIFQCSLRALSEISVLQSGFEGRMHSSNKNENDHQACKMNEVPDLNKIIQEVERRNTLLYKRSG